MQTAALGADGGWLNSRPGRASPRIERSCARHLRRHVLQREGGSSGIGLAKPARCSVRRQHQSLASPGTEIAHIPHPQVVLEDHGPVLPVRHASIDDEAHPECGPPLVQLQRGSQGDVCTPINRLRVHQMQSHHLSEAQSPPYGDPGAREQLAFVLIHCDEQAGLQSLDGQETGPARSQFRLLEQTSTLQIAHLFDALMLVAAQCSVCPDCIIQALQFMRVRQAFYLLQIATPVDNRKVVIYRVEIAFTSTWQLLVPADIAVHPTYACGPTHNLLIKTWGIAFLSSASHVLGAVRRAVSGTLSLSLSFGRR